MIPKGTSPLDVGACAIVVTADGEETTGDTSLSVIITPPAATVVCVLVGALVALTGILEATG